MESLWRQIIWYFVILSLNNAAINGYNVPAGLSVPSLQFWNEEGKKVGPFPPPLNSVRRDIPPLACTGVPDFQRGVLLQDGIGPSVTSSIATPQTLPPVPLPPPILNNPLPQKSPCPVLLSHPCPTLTASGLSGTPTILPTPPVLPRAAPILPDLYINGPPLAQENRILPCQQTQLSLNNMPPTAVLPHVCLTPPNIQQNLPPPIPDTVSLVPPSQGRIIQVNTCPTASVLPEFSSQSPSFQNPNNYPTFLPPGTATIIPTIPQYTNENTFVPLSSDVQVYQPGYQVTVLPAVSSVQSATEAATSSASYSPSLISSETYYSDQLPINMQLTSPEQAAPMPMPFFPPAPIIMMKSGSNWKRWLPTLLVSLFTRRCQGNGCGSCSSCDSSDNVYVPYPIPVPTNNPIILNGGYTNDEEDEYNCVEENED